MDAVQVKNLYLQAFPDWEKTALAKDPFWLRETREKALAQFAENAPRRVLDIDTEASRTRVAARSAVAVGDNSIECRGRE